jgi:hypothetical protein
MMKNILFSKEDFELGILKLVGRMGNKKMRFHFAGKPIWAGVRVRSAVATGGGASFGARKPPPPLFHPAQILVR